MFCGPFISKRYIHKQQDGLDFHCFLESGLQFSPLWEELRLLSEQQLVTEPRRKGFFRFSAMTTIWVPTEKPMTVTHLLSLLVF